MIKVFTAVISRNMPFWDHVSHFNMAASYAAQHNIRTTIYTHIGDSLLCRARTECMYKFLKSDADYLFTVDDDVALPPDAITMLVRADKDMVGGMYLLKNDKPSENQFGKWISARLVNEEDLEKRALEPKENDQLMPALYLSTGCVMHKREFVTNVWEHYRPTMEYDNLSVFHTLIQNNDPTRVAVYQPFIYKREYLSEDWAFCRRAIEAGYDDIWLHAGVRCKHFGIKAYEFPSAWNANKVIQ